MKFNLCIIFLMNVLSFLFHIDAGAQNIRGDTIYVDVNSVVAIVFPSSPSAKLDPITGQDGLYEVREMAKNTISIMALKKGAMDQGLFIEEGKRKHFLILSYKAGKNAENVDWSSVRKLSRHAEVVKKGVIKILNDANSLYDQAKNNISDQALWEGLKTKYEGLVNIVEPGDAGVVNSRLEESRKQLEAIKEKKYVDASKEGQNYYSLKKYHEASQAYQKALEEKPGDAQALKYKNLNDSVWAKVYIDKGDSASKAKNYVLAKINYQEAWNIKEDYPFLQNKFKQAKEDAVPQIYEIEKKKGDLAFRAYDIPEARRAYDSALSVRPGDKEIKSQLKKLIIEEEKIKMEEKIETEYQEILAAAKSLADKASNKQEYDLAIKEYQRATKVIPSRKFPWKKIDELTKIKKGIGAK